MKYEVVFRDGSVGGGTKVVKTFDSDFAEAEARQYASRMNKVLTPGEKSYYKMKYIARKIKEGKEPADNLSEGFEVIKTKLQEMGSLGSLSPDPTEEFDEDQCPVCGTDFSKFLEEEPGVYECPECGFVADTREDEDTGFDDELTEGTSMEEIKGMKPKRYVFQSRFDSMRAIRAAETENEAMEILNQVIDEAKKSALNDFGSLNPESRR